jgi:hypothetical protein
MVGSGCSHETAGSGGTKPRWDEAQHQYWVSDCGSVTQPCWSYMSILSSGEMIVLQTS